MNYLLINYLISIFILFYSFVDSENSTIITNDLKYANETYIYDRNEHLFSIVPYYILGGIFVCCLPCLICVGW